MQGEGRDGRQRFVTRLSRVSRDAARAIREKSATAAGKIPGIAFREFVFKPVFLSLSFSHTRITARTDPLR